MDKVLVLNPGSTSTKIAVYEDEKQLFVTNIEHDNEIIETFDAIYDQFEFRKKIILDELKKRKTDPAELTCIVARGGLIPPCHAGAYKVNEEMCDQLKYHPYNEHASNLGAPIAYAIAQENGDIPAYIYDPVTVDELQPIARYTGFPGTERKGIGHNLNMRAMAMRYADEHGKNYSELSVIVVHMGGGITTSIHHQGKIIDTINDEEGSFSPERAGGLPTPQVIKIAFSGKYDEKGFKKALKNSGGLQGYLGTKDSREVEKMIENGDQKAKQIYEAMAYQISKNIGELATVVGGKIEAIILTGGIAHSDLFTDWIRDRVSFIAPVVVYAGENEMESLLKGALRVRRGQEEAEEFRKNF